MGMCFLKMAQPETVDKSTGPLNENAGEDSNFMPCPTATSYAVHAYNAATRALEGDETPANPEHAKVLEGPQRAKALVRRAQACIQLLEEEEEKNSNNGDKDKDQDKKEDKPAFKAKPQGPVTSDNAEKDLKTAENLADFDSTVGKNTTLPLWKRLKSIQKAEDKREKAKLG